MNLSVGTKNVAIAVSAVFVTLAAGLLIQKSVIEQQGLDMTRQRMKAIVGSAELIHLLESDHNTEWVAVKKMVQNEGFGFRAIARFPNGTTAQPKSEEIPILGLLESGSQEEYLHVDRENDRLTYGRPIRLGADCHGCHAAGAAKLAGTNAVYGAFLLNASTKPIEDTVAAGMTKFTLWLVPVALLVGFLSFWMTQKISRPLKDAVVVLEKVAQGDLTPELQVTSGDEVGQMATALNGALVSLRETLGGVRSAASDVSGASGELQSASEQLSGGAQDQAASLDEISGSLVEITATVKQNAEHARQANQLAAGSSDAAERGGEVVGAAVTAMSEISESSRRIAGIIGTIDEIAFQTNLLALNAAVEAARAGEQGRGFAVVAAEVRSLAQRSASSAKEIKSLIQDSLQKVESGTQLVDQSGKTLDEIVASVKRLTAIVSDIASASVEQATGIEQVSQATIRMDRVTQSNSAQTQQLSATARGLNDQAGRLQRLVARFELGD